MTSIVEYYDGFRERLVEDHEIQNPRVVSALEFARYAFQDVTIVLDVGCGIGWSSRFLADQGMLVHGVDISPVLVETAREMFGGASCSFSVADFADYEPARYGGVLMIDVYEHFAPEQRAGVHAAIRKTEARRIVLALPTPKTQQYARDNGIPLQPIDEDVTDADLEALAEAIGGSVTVNRPVSIWRTADYRHVLIEV